MERRVNPYESFGARDRFEEIIEAEVVDLRPIDYSCLWKYAYVGALVGVGIYCAVTTLGDITKNLFN